MQWSFALLLFLIFNKVLLGQWRDPGCVYGNIHYIAPHVSRVPNETADPKLLLWETDAYAPPSMLSRTAARSQIVLEVRCINTSSWIELQAHHVVELLIKTPSALGSPVVASVHPGSTVALHDEISGAILPGSCPTHSLTAAWRGGQEHPHTSIKVFVSGMLASCSWPPTLPLGQHHGFSEITA